MHISLFPANELYAPYFLHFPQVCNLTNLRNLICGFYRVIVGFDPFINGKASLKFVRFRV